MAEYESFVSKIDDITVPTVDDVVDYRIYVWPLPSTVAAYHARLQEILDFVHTEIVKDYIWQDEPFSLCVVEGLESSSLEPAIPLDKNASITGTACHFFGSTRFGDNIEDEWFIVHILQSLSKRFGDLYSRYEEKGVISNKTALIFMLIFIKFEVILTTLFYPFFHFFHLFHPFRPKTYRSMSY